MLRRTVFAGAIFATLLAVTGLVLLASGSTKAGPFNGISNERAPLGEGEEVRSFVQDELGCTSWSNATILGHIASVCSVSSDGAWRYKVVIAETNHPLNLQKRSGVVVRMQVATRDVELDSQFDIADQLFGSVVSQERWNDLADSPVVSREGPFEVRGPLQATDEVEYYVLLDTSSRARERNEGFIFLLMLAPENVTQTTTEFSYPDPAVAPDTHIRY